MCVDEDGALVWKSDAWKKVQGSHDTSLRIRCDGHTVTLSGNVSRFGRRDNVFGLSLADTVAKASAIVGRYGLPPFTVGQVQPVFRKRNGSTLEARPEHNGARISRIDMTCNYSAGSMENARAYMDWLATQQHSRRIKVDTYGGSTVDWGRGSRRLYAKAYLKSDELKRHKGPDDLIGYCEQVGLVRFELTAKATQLQSMGCHTLGGIHMGRLIQLFDEKRSVMSRATRDTDDLDNLPRALRCTARDYLAGANLLSALTDRTFRRHRAGLLEFGIDISVPQNVAQFRPRIRVIELGSVAVPDWYELESRFAA